jgi:hypothetical protein
MIPVDDPINFSTLCDTIAVESRNTRLPYSVAYSVTGTIHTYGNGNFVFPAPLEIVIIILYIIVIVLKHGIRIPYCLIVHW